MWLGAMGLLYRTTRAKAVTDSPQKSVSSSQATPSQRRRVYGSNPSSHQQRHVIVRFRAVAPFTNSLSDDCGEFIQRLSSVANQQISKSPFTELLTVLIFRFGNSIGKRNEQVAGSQTHRLTLIMVVR